MNYSDPWGLSRWDGEDNGEDDVDEEIHVIGNRIYLPAGGGGIVAAGGGGGGRITGAPREDGMVATGSDQVVPIACNQGGLAGCFVITAQRIVQNVTSGGYVNIGCRGCPQTRAMTNGWQQEDPTSYLNGAGARAAEARMLLGLGQAQAENITTAVNWAVGLSVALPVALTAAAPAVEMFAVGSEITIGSNIRIAIFGNRTGHPIGRWMHYHRRGLDQLGQTRPGQGIGRHRPWERKSPDTSFWDRF